MAKMGLIENGLRKRRVKRRRRNPATVAKVSAKRNPARRAVSLASAKAFAKKNGLKMVSRSVANPKRRKHRRNGLVTAKSYTRSRNGLLGNSKDDARQVGTLLGGAALTKIAGRIANSFLGQYLAQVGVGQYAEVIIDGAIAAVITPFIAGKLLKQKDSAKMARLGGLLVVGLDLVEVFAPNALQWNPFNISPIVMTSAGAAVSPAAVAQIAQEVANAQNPQIAAAKVGNAMLGLDTAGAQGYVNDYQSSGAPELVL